MGSRSCLALLCLRTVVPVRTMHYAPVQAYAGTQHHKTQTHLRPAHPPATHPPTHPPTCDIIWQAYEAVLAMPAEGAHP
jgi:hypothetical protein